MKHREKRFTFSFEQQISCGRRTVLLIAVLLLPTVITFHRSKHQTFRWAENKMNEGAEEAQRDQRKTERKWNEGFDVMALKNQWHREKSDGSSFSLYSMWPLHCPSCFPLTSFSELSGLVFPSVISSLTRFPTERLMSQRHMRETFVEKAANCSANPNTNTPHSVNKFFLRLISLCLLAATWTAVQ